MTVLGDILHTSFFAPKKYYVILFSWRLRLDFN